MSKLVRIRSRPVYIELMPLSFTDIGTQNTVLKRISDLISECFTQFSEHLKMIRSSAIG